MRRTHRLIPLSLTQYDVGLCAYTSLMRIVAKFHEELFSDPDTATGLNKVTKYLWMTYARVVAYETHLRQSIDFKVVTKHHDDNLTTFNDEWKEKFAENDTGGEWSFLCIILCPLIHFSSKLDRILIRVQVFFASFVRVSEVTCVFDELICSLFFQAS